MTTASLLHRSHEQYRYAREGTRLLKSAIQPAKRNEHRYQVRYLPGLEIRSSATGDRQTENLWVITVNGTRILHWHQGRPEDVPSGQTRFCVADRTGSSQSELDGEGKIISREQYYPFGGTAVWATRNQTEARYKAVRYSGKERDVTGLTYYGYRYYTPLLMRWLNGDPAGMVDGVNLFRMVQNNPMTLYDSNGQRSLFERFATTAYSSVINFLNKVFTKPLSDTTNEIIPAKLEKFQPLGISYKQLAFTFLEKKNGKEYLTVSLHGGPNDRNGEQSSVPILNNSIVNGTWLGQTLMKNVPDFEKYEGISLAICYSARGGEKNSIAQQVATETGKTTIGYEKLVCLTAYSKEDSNFLEKTAINMIFNESASFNKLKKYVSKQQEEGRNFGLQTMRLENDKKEEMRIFMPKPKDCNPKPLAIDVSEYVIPRNLLLNQRPRYH